MQIATQISLLDIVDSFDNGLRLSMPELDNFPADALERLIATMEQVIGAARQELDRLTVADLLENRSHFTPA